MSPLKFLMRILFKYREFYWRFLNRKKHDFHIQDPPKEWVLDFKNMRTALEADQIIREADKQMRGEYSFLNISIKESPINWNYEHNTGKLIQLDYCFDIDSRDTAKNGHVKDVWGKNRHQHLTLLALAYSLSDDERYAKEVNEQLSNWVDQNPVMRGINWTSSLELGIRLISWVWIERLLRKSKFYDNLFGDNGLLWISVYWHQLLIRKHYSVGSSANNHLIGEATGLFLSTEVWHFHDKVKAWNHWARKILEKQIKEQTYESGVNREQAFSYHIFSLEFLLLAAIEAERFGNRFSQDYYDLLQKAVEVIPQLTDYGGNRPRYGDSDDGIAIKLSPKESSPLDWIYNIGASWLNTNIPVSMSGEGLICANLLLSGLTLQDSNIKNFNPPHSSEAFKDTGLFVLSSNRNKPSEIFCLVKAGELGYKSIAAHGHADSLSFTLSLGGVPILIDPGTYVYDHMEPYWRKYFRSTQAHNTIEIDKKDQSVSKGLFLWTRKANTEVILWHPTPDGGIIIAQHDGYKRLKGRPIHKRRFEINNNKININDQILGTGNHQLDFRLHFAPNCEVKLYNQSAFIICRDRKIKISFDENLSLSLEYGENGRSWYSSGFNLIEPTITITGKMESQFPVKFNTIFEVLK